MQLTKENNGFYRLGLHKNRIIHHINNTMYMKTKQLLISSILLMLAGTGASVRAQVAINATNFPDEAFRTWVSSCDTDRRRHPQHHGGGEETHQCTGKGHCQPERH